MGVESPYGGGSRGNLGGTLGSPYWNQSPMQPQAQGQSMQGIASWPALLQMLGQQQQQGAPPQGPWGNQPAFPSPSFGGGQGGRPQPQPPEGQGQPPKQWEPLTQPNSPLGPPQGPWGNQPAFPHPPMGGGWPNINVGGGNLGGGGMGAK